MRQNAEGLKTAPLLCEMLPLKQLYRLSLMPNIDTIKSPWILDVSFASIFIRDCEGKTICMISHPLDTAKAQLMHAAPELYDALLEMVELMENREEPGAGTQWHMKARTALGKASGRTIWDFKVKRLNLE